jgi:hypothetical protein
VLEKTPLLFFTDAIAGHRQPHQLVGENAFNHEVRAVIAHGWAFHGDKKRRHDGGQCAIGA